MTQNPVRKRREPDEIPEDADSETGPRDVEQELASGQPASTPFALTGIVAVVLWGVAAIVVAILFLVIWLA